MGVQGVVVEEFQTVPAPLLYKAEKIFSEVRNIHTLSDSFTHIHAFRNVASSGVVKVGGLGGQ